MVVLIPGFAFGVQQRITVQLDGTFAVDEVLLRLPAPEKIKLPLRFVLCGQRAMAHVDHRGPGRRRSAVVDVDLREGHGAAVSFHCLTQSLNRVIQSGGQIAWISPTSHRNFEPVRLARIRSGARRVEEGWQRGRCGSEQSKGLDHRAFGRLERSLSNELTGGCEFVRCELVLVCRVMSTRGRNPHSGRCRETYWICC